MSIEQWIKNSLSRSSFMAPAPIRALCVGGGSPFLREGLARIIHKSAAPTVDMADLPGVLRP